MYCKECQRREEYIDRLKEQISDMKKQLKEELDDHAVDILRDALGLYPTEAKALIFLHSRKEKYTMPHKIAEVIKCELASIAVMFSRMRKKLGADFIENNWASGYRVSAAMREKIDALLVNSISPEQDPCLHPA